MKLYKDAAGVMVTVTPGGNSYTKLYPHQRSWGRASDELVKQAIDCGQLKLIGNNYRQK